MIAVDDWSGARRILCVRLDGIGDVLMTTPAIRAIRASALGDATITLLASPAGAEVAPLIPEIDEVIVYEAPWMKATSPRGSGVDLEMVKYLASRKFDAAAIFTVYSQNPLPAALLCYLAEIPRRLAHCRENPYQLLTTWVKETEPDSGVRHEVQRHLDLVETIGCRAGDTALSLTVPPTCRSRVDELLSNAGVDRTGRWLVIHPGATAPSRRYPAESFVEVARGLDSLGWQIVYAGGPDDRALVEDIRAASCGVSLAGQLDLGDLGALLEAAPLLVANNSGPVHMAAAVGTPVVDLYALTNPQHRPWGVPSRVLSHDVPCRWCYKSICPEGHHDCLRLVTPQQVLSAVSDLYAEVSQSTPIAAG